MRRNIRAFALALAAFDTRYRAINTRACHNPEELVGTPQNPRRFTLGFDLRLK